MEQTLAQYEAVIKTCKEIFLKKMQDYGAAWRIMRAPSLTDQIYIKVRRIRTLQEQPVRKIEEDEEAEFIGIVNYAIMALIQLEKGAAEEPDLGFAAVEALYDAEVAKTMMLMQDKNHDYGEAWRDLRIPSITDLIFQKTHRIRQIEANKGQTLISEGIESNYRDLINYACFALILIQEHKS